MNGPEWIGGEAQLQQRGLRVAAQISEPALQVHFPPASLLPNTETWLTSPPKRCRMPKFCSGSSSQAVQGILGM